MNYPVPHSEEVTLDLVLRGSSIGRYGDGELKLMLGRDCVSQRADKKLQEELRSLLAAKNTKALMGIPTLDPRGPKNHLWNSICKKFVPFLRSGREYYSAFITRPDSAPWLSNAAYFDKVESLWKGQCVTFVGNGVRSLTKEFLLETGAADVVWIKCSYRDAYSEIDRLEALADACPNERVILCVGPTATCLAERLAKHGKHAVDLGHIGMFWRRYDLFGWKEQREINQQTGEVEKNPK